MSTSNQAALTPAEHPVTAPSYRVGAGILSSMSAGAFWGLIFVIPLLLPQANAWQLSAARYLVYGGVALLLILPRWRQVFGRLGRAEWQALLGLSLLGNIVYYVLLVWGVQWAGAAPTALIIGLIPVVSTLMGLRSHKTVSLTAMLAPLCLCVLGTALVAMHSLTHGSAATESTNTWQRALGLLAAAGALLTWSTYSIWNSQWLMRRRDISPWDWSLLTGLVTGALAILLAIPAFGVPWWTAASDFSDQNWLRFWVITGTLAILASVVGNAFWNHASRLLPLTMIGQMIVFETIFALVYGFLYEWRWPGVQEWLAMTALIAGVLWCARLHQKAH
ncbi:DMT family transporter [Lampropedia puyangensis]|uniref:DMT family transporter n=1 Tax=Lampropedia puyangensis TaxID=1330072 RepID=A0A4S8FBA4_9BURK|nr:DMT family transporter [Lampropedia puyangensis]THU02872.1 DMT family transporter [Lampropedia puyangensis]